MKSVFLQVNSGHVRHPPHEGVICTTLYVPVTLTDKPVVMHNGRKLLTIVDGLGKEHLVDEWYVVEERNP
jgi:hypothetical protein